MKVTINRHTVFRFPTRLIVNRITAAILRIKLKKEGLLLTRKQTIQVIKEYRKYKRNHPDWNIAEIIDSDGDTVKITI